MKLEFYNNQKTYMYPSGAVASPDRVRKDYPAINLFPHVIEVSGNVIQAINEFEALKDLYEVVESDPQKALLEIELRQKEIKERIPEPSAEERIAAALEFNNLLGL